MFNAFFPALEREKHPNMELEKQRLSAEKENGQQRERSRKIEREKNMITRELTSEKTRMNTWYVDKFFCHYIDNMSYRFEKRFNTYTHVKISQLVASLQTSRQQVVFGRLVTSCQQVWNRLLTS